MSRQEGVLLPREESTTGSGEARLVCGDDHLDAVTQLKFGEDVGDMGFDRCPRDVELFADLGVGKAFGHESEDFDFPFGQGVETLDLGRLRPTGEFGDQPLGD
jgi:hypothetical protein